MCNDYMTQAIELARQVLGATSPNPAVGAVIVKEGKEIGRGATQPPGQNHAEIGALRQAGDASRGATLYTTLEPCCTHGRTPPCTDAIISSGVSEVRFAAIDPNPQVSGKGRAALESAGISVVAGEHAEAASELYEAFAKHINTGLPFVTAKYAMSTDGKIATRTGDSRWVTGRKARDMVQQMRRECDAVMVGVNTVLADDPQLTVRDANGESIERQPLRVVLDSRCRTPAQAKLLNEPGRTIIAVGPEARSADIGRLITAGAVVLQLPSADDGRASVSDLLKELGGQGVVSVLVEGGGTVLGSLFDSSLVDKVYAFIAPVIIGGSGASSPVEGNGAPTMSSAWSLERTRVEQVGPDWLLVGYPAARS